VIPAALFLLSAAVLLALASRPAIEIREDRLVIGGRAVPWAEIRRVDPTGWVSPLVVSLTLAGGKRLLLVHPGDLDSANSLLWHLRRSARCALIDGVPHRRFWGQAGPPAPAGGKKPSPRYPLLRPEDEAEVEMLFHRLKAVGRLDPTNSADEK
jgi:hypothetical protein